LASAHAAALRLVTSLALFSLAGIPPLAGFYAKLFVLEGLLRFQDGYLAYIAILASAVATANYLRIVGIAWSDSFSPQGKPEPAVVARPNAYLLAYFCVFQL